MLALVGPAEPADAVYRRSAENQTMLLPDLVVTPGVVVISDPVKVCRIRWSLDERHVTAAMKRRACERYGVRDCPGPKYVIDHLVSRELGGADDPDNLWPQERRQAQLKDRLELALHRDVCAGTMTLEDAQRRISQNWFHEYLVRFGRPTR